MFKKPYLSSLKRVKHIFLNSLWFGLWLFGIGLLLNYLLRWWPGDQWLPVRLISSLTPWFLIGLLPSLMLAWLGRRYRLMIALALPALFIIFTYAPLFMPRVKPALAAKTPLKVMSYNIWRKNKDMEAVAAVIRQEQPDILLLQELHAKRAIKLSEALNDLYFPARLHMAYEPELLQGVISRYPITSLEGDRQKGDLQKVIIDTPHGPINVWNAHPRPAPWTKHISQFSALTEDVAAVKGPLILGGDFNTNEQLETYKMINEHLYNAHWQAGWGFAFTFPNNRRSPAMRKRLNSMVGDTPLVRIDHIFYSDHFFANSAGTLKEVGGSDHSPVVATLSYVR